MFRSSKLATALALAIPMCAPAMSPAAPLTYLNLLDQSIGLPEDFRDNFFDTPLIVNILLNHRKLGEATITLSRQEHVTLVDFTDTNDSDFQTSEIEKWKSTLQKGITLGQCEKQCANGLLTAHYSLENSELSLLSEDANYIFSAGEFHDLPDNGSTGLVVRNQVNVAGGQQQDAYGRLALQGVSSVGNWTQTLSGQVSRNDSPVQSSQYQVNELHTQKEWHRNFLRVGYFTPNSIGLIRQARAFGNHPDTAVGVMMGSSDSLTRDVARPAIYPIYVTPSRSATVEIYRNNSLINSQQVEAGLQSLDTRSFPGGIYDVEIRVLEDGIVTSTTDELVYKPNNWNNYDQRWRYNAFLGKDSAALSNVSNSNDSAPTFGVAANYLIHPRAVVGVSARKVNDQNQLSTSVDVGLGAQSKFYTNVYTTQDHGTGTDIQALHNYGSGNVIVSHNRSWLDTHNAWETLPDGTRIRRRHAYRGNVNNTSAGINHRIGHHNSLNARISYSEGQANGIGLDAGWLRSTRLFSSDASWRLSIFDRPGSASTEGERNRGIDLSLNLAIGTPGKRISASFGQWNSRNGAEDRNANLGYQQDIEEGSLRQLNANVNSDTSGIGLNGSTRFETDIAYGDAFIQRSSYSRKISGNLNVESTVVAGVRKVTMTGQHLSGDAVMIVDLESDFEDIELRADDLSGHQAILRTGRNVVPVSAYQRGAVQFDFQGVDAPAASIQPPRSSYHLNKGGVAYQQVRLSRTFTVLGRIVDGSGKPLKGVHVLNHASRGVTEADGFFSMELSSKTPSLEVIQGDQIICRLVLDSETLKTEGDLLMAGDLPCLQGSELEGIASAGNS